jgi:DNA-binding transcriptional ArsR family regulator
MNHESLVEHNARLAGGPRFDAIDQLVSSVRSIGDDREFNALAMVLVDATLEADEPTLEHLFTRLQRLSAELERQETPPEALYGRILGFIDVGRWALERMLPSAVTADVERSSHAHRILSLINEEPGRSNSEIAALLGVDDTAVSRIGRRLVEGGLARKRRVGRTNQWEITPRGVRALAVVDQGGVPRHRRPHSQRLTT